MNVDMNKVKELISLKQKEGKKTNKRKIENLVIFLVLLVITVIVINTMWTENVDETMFENDDPNVKLVEEDFDLPVVQANTNINQDELEIKLENILSNISGVGEVKVMVTYSNTSTFVPLYNEDYSQSNTEETDSSGGTRVITQTDKSTEIIYKEENGIKEPITQNIISPVIEGAIVTAQGATNAQVKTNIISAVEAVTGIATHKIQVFEMKTN